MRKSSHTRWTYHNRQQSSAVDIRVSTFVCVSCGTKRVDGTIVSQRSTNLLHAVKE